MSTPETNTVATPAAPAAPKFKVAFPASIVVKGQELTVEKDPIKDESFVIFRDDKLGEIKVWLYAFTKGDKQGLKYCVPEYPSLQAQTERFTSDVVADGFNSFLASKATQRVNARWNSMTNTTLVSKEQKEINLATIKAKDYWLNSPDDALDLSPGQQGDSMSGLQRLQREIMAQITEAAAKKDYKAVSELTVRFNEATQRMVKFLEDQNRELQEQADALASIVPTE